MIFAEVRCTHPDLPLSDTIGRVPEVRIQPEYQGLADPNLPQLFFSASGEALDAFESALREDHTVSDLHLVSAYGDRRVYRVELAAGTKFVTSACAQLGVRVLSVESERGGWLLRVQLPSRDELVAFREYCLENDIAFTLLKLYQSDLPSEGGDAIRPEQRRILRLALEAGYYEVPRRVTQRELATELGVSTSAVSQQLRRATAQLIRSALGPKTESESID